MQRIILALACLGSVGHAVGRGQTVQEVIAWQNQADRLRAAGNYAEALPIYQRMLAAVPGLWGAGSPTHAIAYHKIGVNYMYMRRYADGETALAEAVRIRQAKLGDQRDTADSLHMLALLYENWNRLDQAEAIYLRSLAMRERVFGKVHIDVADSLNNLGLVYAAKANYTKARDTYLRCLEVHNALPQRNDISFADAMGNLATAYNALGDFAQAEKYYLRAYETYVAKLGPNHLRVAGSCNDLAILNRDMGRFLQSEQYHRRALKIREAALGPNHVDVAQSLHNLGILYQSMNQNDKAEAHLQRALTIREAVLGPQTVRVADTVNSLGQVHFANGNMAQAEAFFLRALRIYEAELGPKHVTVGMSLSNLGNVYRATRELDRAEKLFLRSLEIREAALGRDHRNVADALNNLASIYADRRDHAKCEPLFLRAMQIWEARLGPDHPSTQYYINNVATTYALRHNWAQALTHARKGRQTATKSLVHFLPMLSEKEQLKVLAGDYQKHYHQSLSIGWSAPDVAGAASAEWLLNGKALGYQSLAEQQLLARDAKTPAVKALIAELQQTRTRLAALVHVDGNAMIVRELTAREQELAEQLARTVGRSYRGNPWLTLDALRARLHPKTVFIDIARLDLHDFNKDDARGYHYVAWITPPAGQGDVKIIDLGESAAIETLAEQVRKAIIDSTRTIAKVGEQEALKALNKPLGELSAKVLHPLLPTIEKFDEWVICPDGALWLTPWHALPLAKGEFAAEKFLIRHVISGRDLLQEAPKVKTSSAYILADPDYGAQDGNVLLGRRLRGALGTWNLSFEFRADAVIFYDEDTKGEIVNRGTWSLEKDKLTIQTKNYTYVATLGPKEIRGERTLRQDDGTQKREAFRMEAPQRANGALAPSLALPPVTRLPGTALEAEAIRPRIEKWLGEEPKVYLEDKASESVVKSLKSPRLLTLATHGFALPRPEAGQALENPLLRCGLLLAGCNKRTQASGEDDGILTGLEIVGLNLQGCDLVVLSACETGLGDVRHGEGVAGLRQSFQLAGAKGVLASLWQVPDRETALLMNAFYGELANGKSQAEALRQAQLQRIAARRQQFGAAHPFFWAAFTLTNRGVD